MVTVNESGDRYEVDATIVADTEAEREEAVASYFKRYAPGGYGTQVKRRVRLVDGAGNTVGYRATILRAKSC